MNQKTFTLESLNSLKPPFSVPPLPYQEDSLQPLLDGETMIIHHDKHHQAYVDKLNAAVTEHKNHQNLLEIFKSASTQVEAIKNNAGGHWNHSFFWTILSGEKNDRTLPPELSEELEKEFGSLVQFKEVFVNAGVKVFGSGWVWLTVNSHGLLEITTTPNQDNPLMNNVKHPGTPILCLDVWEHAYYLTYRNDRKAFLEAAWKLINWNQVFSYYQEALNSYSK